MTQPVVVTGGLLTVFAAWSIATDEVGWAVLACAVVVAVFLPLAVRNYRKSA